MITSLTNSTTDTISTCLHEVLNKELMISHCLHYWPGRKENGDWIWKCSKCFSSPLGNNPRSFCICVYIKENSQREIKCLSRVHRSRKASFSKCFPSALKLTACVFKFPWFKERFRKALLSWRISVDVRPNRRNKAAFSNFSSVVWTGSHQFGSSCPALVANTMTECWTV